jgi:biopolymer transport protein TolR
MPGTAVYRDEDSGEGMISDINVTPLVDVTLVLLIIFMVTASLIVERGISIETPKTASGAEVKSTLAVTIDRERVMYVNGENYGDTANARAAVEAALAKTPELKAIISADKTVPHGDVMKAIDMVKLAGVTKFALASDPLPEEEEEQ